jgi:hypothetical protein
MDCLYNKCRYGFERAEFWRDFQDAHKYLVPTQCPEDVVVTDTSKEEPVKALLVFSSPRDWGKITVCDMFTFNRGITSNCL